MPISHSMLLKNRQGCGSGVTRWHAVAVIRGWGTARSLLLVAAFLSGACTAEAPAQQLDPEPPRVMSASPSSTPMTTSAATASASPQCAGGPGQSVTQLPDITVAAITVPEVRSPAVEIDGRRIPSEVLPEITIPAQVVDGGCIIEHDAPGGCIGSVEISGVRIPALTIPGTVVSEVKAADGRTLAGRILEPVTLPAVTVPPVRAPRVCQVATHEGVPTVTRPGIVRQAATRSGGARPGFTRPSLCGRVGVSQSSESRRSGYLQYGYLTLTSIPSASAGGTCPRRLRYSRGRVPRRHRWRRCAFRDGSSDAAT